VEIHVILVRIALGLVLGAAVGIERQWRARMAGLRTNALVSLGATLFVIMGAYGFQGPDADPTRVAAQIVSGIGFLGAGVIFKGRNVVRGLTTAASIWVSAAVGMACGAGMLSLAVSLTAFHLITLYVVSPVIRKIPTPDAHRVLHLGYDDNRGVLRQVLEIATNMGFSSSILSINKAGDEQKPIVLMDIRFHGHLPLRELVPYLLDVPGVQSVTVRGTDPNEDDDDPSA
jgi:putative Mg2+ transporter-C (MgtC) family protein